MLLFFFFCRNPHYVRVQESSKNKLKSGLRLCTSMSLGYAQDPEPEIAWCVLRAMIKSLERGGSHISVRFGFLQLS